MIGQTLHHYRVHDRIGAGGMGEVYRAHDEQLGRDVAIKVVAATIADDPAAGPRLLREARAAAALNHPHICTIYELGEVAGQPFIAMELIDGEPLDRLIPARGLPIEQVRDYGLQVADALRHAHDRGVIHRDLKTANVLVTRERRVKVLDFGLAKRLSAVALAEATTAAPTVTEGGAFAGTLPYMSPEQFRGEPADARTDIWALGVVLYEMAAGARPFVGRTGFEVSSAVLSQPPAPLPSEVPAQLRAVIERCLEKDPARRYQSAGEVAAALDVLGPARAGALLAWRFRIVRRPWLAAVTALIVLAAALLGLDARGLRTRLWSGAGLPRVESLAVLPLENLSGDAGQDYFADGMTEALSTDLARLGGVRRVIARGSAMRYKGSTKPLAEIARELRVDALITGAVLRAGDRVRITAQLIDPATGAQLWADRYERDLRDVLALQGEVTRAIADRIKAKLTTQEQARLVSAGPVNADAYDAYLKGLVHLYKQTQQDVDTALAYFQLARDKDPRFAPAYAGIARVWAWRAHLGRVPAREAYPEMNEAVMRAVALDDSLPEVHDALASLRAWFDWDWAAGEREYRRAIELNPSNAEARVFYSMMLTCVGRPREGRAQIERALELDPHNAFFQWALGLQLLWERRYDEAIAQLRKALAIQPNSPDAQAFLVLALHQKGKYEEELAERKKRASPEVVEALNRGYAQGGYSGAMRMAAERLAARFHQGNLGATAVATHYALAGDKDRALEWLERGYEERTSQMVFLKVHPQWDGLRSDPRYLSLLRRMKFPN